MEIELHRFNLEARLELGWQSLACPGVAGNRSTCTDCGVSYLDANYGSTDTPHASTSFLGGGSIVASRDLPITEVHIIPHGGTELPGELVGDLDDGQRDQLGTLVHDNADTATAAIYAWLAKDVRSGRLPGAVVAGFHVSRLLIDANRAIPQFQIPAQPYVGNSRLYGEYQQRNAESLRTLGLQPWIDGVNNIISQLSDAVVYHHHTYDLRSLSPRPFDSAPGAERPAFQLSWKRTGLEEESSGYIRVEDIREGGLAQLATVNVVHNQIVDFLDTHRGIQHDQRTIDFPLLLPLTAFSGTRDADVDHKLQHVLYDIRKDMLDSAEMIDAWLSHSPWRIK